MMASVVDGFVDLAFKAKLTCLFSFSSFAFS